MSPWCLPYRYRTTVSLFYFPKLSKRPARVRGHKFVWRFGQPGERRAKLRLPAIPHSDRHIAQEPAIFRTAHWTPTKHLREFFFRQRGQFRERWGEFARRKSGFMRHGSPLIPGTHVLADVATEHMIAHRAAVLFRNIFPKLNGEVRNAQASIKFPSNRIRGRADRRRGTSVDTTRAGSTAVRRRSIRREIKRSK